MTYEYALSKGTVLRHSPVLGKESVYTIEKVLGQGGFGITYLASSNIVIGNTEHKLYFAIKEFFVKGQCWRDASSEAVSHKNFWRKIVGFLKGNRRIAKENDCIMRYSPAAKIEIEECLKDFIEEANRLNRICREDEHIVNVNEIFEANGTAYYVMEFLNGGSLRDRVLKKGSPIEESEAISYIVPIAQAVAHIHNKHRLLHCDISPDNIILHNTERGIIVPVLIDFGEALHFNSKGILTTKHNTIGAKDGFAPQEQYMGVTSYSPQIDVYALAATLYYLLSARQPISAFDIDADYIDKNLPSYISANVRSAIKHGMERDKKLRTQTVEELLYELTGEHTTDEKQRENDELFPLELPAGFKLNLGGRIYQILEKVGNSSYYLQYKAIYHNEEKNNGQTKHATIYVYEFFDPYNHKRNKDLCVSTKNDDTQSRRKYNELYHMYSSGSLFETNGTLYFTQIKQIKVPFWRRMKSICPNTKKGKIIFALGVLSIILVSLFFGRSYTYKVKGEKNYILATKYLEDKDTISAIPYLNKAVGYGNAAAMTELGICYYKGRGVKSDTIVAFHFFEKAVQQNDAKGQEWLGYMYNYGYGIKKDTIKAYNLYKKSAEQGYKEGMFRLGLCYEEGNGVEKDTLEAFKWYKKSANSGSDNGMRWLGEYYFYGYGIKADTLEAIKWYQKAAALDNATAQWDLGWCYTHGYGVKKDSVKAFNCFFKSATLGNSFAMNKIGWCYMLGEGVNINKKEGFDWFLKGAILDNKYAMYATAYSYIFGEGVAQDSIQGIKWLEKSANKGYISALKKLGYIYRNRGDSLKAFVCFNKAASQNDAEAINELGLCYIWGVGVKADTIKANHYWEKAANLGERDAMYNLALSYENGWGVEKNQAKASYWYRKEKGIEADSTSTPIEHNKTPQKQPMKKTPSQTVSKKQGNNFDNVEFDNL